MKLDRVVEQAKSFEIFDNILPMTELDIPDYIRKHEQFINDNKPGYGYWIWKPKVILDALLSLNENDILVYCDAGMYLNVNGKDRVLQYFEKLDETSILTFSTNDKYKAQYFVKIDAVMEYYSNFLNELNAACYSGLMIIKKTEESVNLINDWLRLCENYHFLDKSPSHQYTETNIFDGNDCDNGLFNLCLAKHKKSVSICYPDEVNLYDEDGNQVAHANCVPNWELLNHIPFQCRRMTPKFGFY